MILVIGGEEIPSLLRRTLIIRDRFPTIVMLPVVLLESKLSLWNLARISTSLLVAMLSPHANLVLA
jgi:hypothetical protein